MALKGSRTKPVGRQSRTRETPTVTTGSRKIGPRNGETSAKPRASGGDPTAPRAADGAKELSLESLCVLYDIENRTFLAYVDLKFRHFVTYTTLTAVTLAGAFTVDPLKDWRPAIAAAGLILTMLFWLIDERTGAYLRVHMRRYETLKAALAQDVLTVHPLPAQGRLFTASNCTRFLFVGFAVIWIAVGIATGF
jgi:hypothetical protein